MNRVNMTPKIEKSKHKKLKMQLLEDELTYQALHEQLIELYLNDVIQVQNGFLTVEVDGEGKKVEVESGQLSISDYIEEG